MNQSRRLVSIIIPVFNEEDNIGPCYKELNQFIKDNLTDYDFEFLFSDNCSTDSTLVHLRSLVNLDSRVRVLKLSRNFGYQRSIFTGYCHARGEAAIQFDCDLQDPPELISAFLKEWESGAKVVYGVRKSRKEGFFITQFRKIFYRLIDLLSEVELPRDAGDFRLVDRCILEEIRKMNDQQPYLRGAIAELGFKQVGIEYQRRERLRGESKFSLSQLLGLAIDGVANHSVIPLRIASYTGLAISGLTFLGFISYLVVKTIFKADWPAGFATTTALILMSLSLNAMFLGIIGEYLGRIYIQVKKNSISIVEYELGSSGAEKK